MQTFNLNTTKWRWLPAIVATAIITACVLFSAAQQIFAESACVAPYLTVEGPGTPGANITTDPTGELSIDRIAIGEPFSGICSEKSITFLMKVHTMDPQNTGQATPLPNAQWEFRFTLPASVTSDHVAHPVFVEMQTEDLPAPTATTVSFAFGYTTASPTGGGLDNGVCSTNGSVFTCPVSGTVTADGTIAVKLNVAAPINFTDATGATVFSATIPPGTDLTALEGDTYVQVGASPGGTGGGLLEQANHTANTGHYVTQGNLACAPGPVAGLSATPLSGPAPLTVTFDASSSLDPNPCATINSFTMNYGDGSPLDTHTSSPGPTPNPTFAHTYTSSNTFTATLVAGNTASQSSAPAQATISATSALPPPLTSVGSRKTHGSTDFDIDLPLVGIRGVECRSGGGFGDYTMVFTFVNPLASVAGASVTSGVGAITSSNIGTDPHQYIVTLTGATFPEYVTVALSAAKDSLGNTGAVSGTMGVLVGDVNGSGRVDSGDVSLVRQQTLQTVTASNFKEDINVSNRIDSGDVSIARQQALTSLPTPP